LPIGGFTPVVAALDPRAARVEGTVDQAAAFWVAISVKLEDGRAGWAVIDELCSSAPVGESASPHPGLSLR
jgi:hypothetical protein